MVNAEPLATGWDRHRSPDKKESGKAKARETGSRLQGAEGLEI